MSPFARKNDDEEDKEKESAEERLQKLQEEMMRTQVISSFYGLVQNLSTGPANLLAVSVSKSKTIACKKRFLNDIFGYFSRFQKVYERRKLFRFFNVLI